jgi:hypothetical protein
LTYLEYFPRNKGGNFEIPAGVNIGVQCEFEYEIQPTKNGSMARLVDIVPIQKMRLSIEPDVVG